MSESLTFESEAPDGSPRVFIGMHRPTLEAVIQSLNGCTVVQLQDGRMIYNNSAQLPQAWREGAFDRPLYQA